MNRLIELAFLLCALAFFAFLVTVTILMAGSMVGWWVLA